MRFIRGIDHVILFYVIQPCMNVHDDPQAQIQDGFSI